MSKIEPCPVPPAERTVGYIHGWNKACKHSSECLPYPKGYLGVKFGAGGSIIPPMTAESGKRIALPPEKFVQEDDVPAPKRKVAPRKKRESKEEKLARARRKRAARK